MILALKSSFYKAKPSEKYADLHTTKSLCMNEKPTKNDGRWFICIFLLAILFYFSFLNIIKSLEIAILIMV